MNVHSGHSRVLGVEELDPDGNDGVDIGENLHARQTHVSPRERHAKHPFSAESAQRDAQTLRLRSFLRDSNKFRLWYFMRFNMNEGQRSCPAGAGHLRCSNQARPSPRKRSATTRRKRRYRSHKQTTAGPGTKSVACALVQQRARL